MAFPKIVLLALATLASTVSADHVVRIKNSCPFPLTPVYKGNHDNPNATRAPTIAAGGTGSFTLPEIWESGRIFPQDPKKTCLEPDGAKCTLAECSFGQPDSAGNKWWQCNISLVSGYNIPTSLGYNGGKDQSCNKVFKCLKPNCQSTEAYLVGDGAASCKNCISQCNTPNVGIAIEWCPPGSVIPDMGQGSNNDSGSGTTTKPPVATPSKPDEDDDDEEEEPTKTPAFPSTPSNDTATKPPNNNIVDTTPKPSPKKCPASRLERQAARKTKRMDKRGKLHFVGHYMPKHGSKH